MPEASVPDGYEKRTERSKKLHKRAKGVFAGGVNHNARFYEPYPIYLTKAKGRFIWDEDNNRYVDYWMGHLALILGHSPSVVTDAVGVQLRRGTHYGMGSSLAVELGEEVQRTVPSAEMMRFCNTGAEATMYLVRLARAYAGKRIVLKMVGGWHGYNTELSMGVHAPFNRVESAGILEEEQAHVKAVPFNNLEAAEHAVRKGAGDVAAIFLEPVLGAGGCIPAEKEYLKGLRELADRTGILLAFDEIITGFRVALGGAQEYYGVTPDIATFGKILGGGFPVGLVCGKKEIISLSDPAKKANLVSIGGGTFSENPITMTAGLATLGYLRKHAGRVYPSLRQKGETLREGVDEAFQGEGLEAHSTGLGSLFFTHFGERPSNAEEAALDDPHLATEFALHMMTNGVFILPRHLGGVSTQHTDKDIEKMIRASRSFGASIRKRPKR